MAPENTSDSASRPQRKVQRYTFVATAELTDAASAARLSGRISEISRMGCYVDLLNTLPVGTLVDVRVTCDQGAFQTQGKIIYVQENMGMGVAFLDPAEDQLKVLDGWIAAFPPSSAI
jgi:hypothetical protein